MTTPPNYSAAAAAAAEAAGRSMLAVAVAAENASKPGRQSSERKLAIWAMVSAGGLAALNALAIIPGPWQLFAALGLVAASASVGYSSARGKIKAGAIAAAGELGKTASGPHVLPPE